MILILSIVLPAIFIVLFGLFATLYIRSKNRQNVFDKGTLLAKIDLNSRKIFVYNTRSNKTTPKLFYDKTKLDK